MYLSLHALVEGCGGYAPAAVWVSDEANAVRIKATTSGA